MTEFRWLRWMTGLSVLIGAGLVLLPLAKEVFIEDGESWKRTVEIDLRRVMQGEISSEMVLRWSTFMMVVAYAWVVGAMVLIAFSSRRSTRFPIVLRPLAAIFIGGGVVLGSTSLVAPSSALAESSADETERGQEIIPPTDLLTEFSDVEIVGVSVVSGLLGAGLGAIWRSKDRETRRCNSSLDEQVFPDADPIPSDELRSEFRRAEESTVDLVSVLKRLRRLAPDNSIRHVIDQRDGWFVVEFTESVQVIPGTEQMSGRAVRMAADRTGEIDQLDSCSDLPAMLHVGRSISGDIWVSLDEYQEFTVDCSGYEGERVWDHLVDSLMVGPTLQDRGVVADVDLPTLGSRRAFRVCSDWSESVEPERIGLGLAVLTGASTSTSLPTLRRSSSGEITTGLRLVNGEWRLLPADIPIQPVGLRDDEIRRIRRVLGEAIGSIEIRDASGLQEDSPSLPPWDFMASILGPPRVFDRRFEPVEFERKKAEELVIWLACHPLQRRRSLARNALWLSPIQDATFSNLTAAARRSLNAVMLPPEGQNWVGITMSDELPLSGGFVTDVEILREAVEWARLRPEDGALERLRDGLRLVRGVPFAGSTYTWSDGIGMSGDAATLVVRAASMMAEMCQESGDISGVYWATAKGLSALPGHEALVALRLRAHADQGDRVAMRAEWESYRRALAGEWEDAEPSPKMMDLWRRISVI